MNFKSVLYVAMTILWFTACDNMGQKGNKTPGGFEFEKTESGEGKEAGDMDYVFFTLKAQGDDGRVLTEIGEGENMPHLHLNNEPMGSPDVDAVADILKGSKVGDAYKLIIPMDSIPQRTPDLAMLNYVEYYLTVKNIRNQKEFDEYVAKMQEERSAKMEAGQLRAKEIEGEISNILKEFKSGSLDVKTKSSGLKYYIVEEGQGDMAKDGDKVSVNYYGVLEDGTKFDESFSRGMALPLTLGAGQVIKGWEEGIALLKKGAKAYLFIPSDLAYGEVGSPPVIPPAAELIFYVEIEDLQAN